MNNKVLQRLINVLTTLESNPQGLSASELARITGYPEAAKEMSEKLYTRGGVTFVETEYLNKLRSAVLGEFKIELKYYAKNNNREVKWLVWPLGSVFHTGNGTWYFVASKEETREVVACHLGRIRGVKVLDEQFVYPEDFSLRHYLRLRWGMDMSRSEVVKVRFYYVFIMKQML